MKACPKCGMEYPDTTTLCPSDGVALEKTDDALIGQILAGKYRIDERLSGGGMGTVRRASAAAIRLLARYRAEAPLSGQRALTAACLAAVRPLAGGFGMETAMTIDAVRAGLRVMEIPVPGLTHRATGRSLGGFIHRGRQGLQIARASLARAVRLR